MQPFCLGSKGRLQGDHLWIFEFQTWTDNWHHIGFVWDGLNKALYIDSVIAAKDTQDSLYDSINSLYIDTGSTMQSGIY